MSKDPRQLSVRKLYGNQLSDPWLNRSMRSVDRSASSLDPKRSLPSSPTKPCNTNRFTNSIGMSFQQIAPGSFVMGNPAAKSTLFLSETPHKTTITKSFYIGCYQVTQAQFQKVMGENPSWFRSGAETPDTSNHPVESVSWYQAYAFCLFLSALPEEQQAGRTYRLPTEAEWEYACRAESSAEYCFGDDPSTLNRYAWHGQNSPARTSPVGTKLPNAWGLYDMHGNVLEWCADWYGPYPQTACSDPSGPTQGYGRVFRGGSFDFSPNLCGSSFRSMNHPTYRMQNLGFRIVTDAI